MGFHFTIQLARAGHFNCAKNNLYKEQLALQFEVDGRLVRTPQDFASVGLSAPHHSKNLLAYEFKVDELAIST